MCRLATCATCGKATYSGCGRHVEQVLGAVPPARRCSCPPAPPAPRVTTGPGLLTRLFGRRVR